MFTINLYKFNKKPNSTAVPASAGTSYSCSMKTVSSLLSPLMEIADTRLTGAIPLYNYAYIPDFDRYYFIDNVSWSRGIWTISMHVDVLGSFRGDILNSRQYVLRSASSYDEDIPDSLYMTKASSYGRSFSMSEYAGTGSAVNGVRYYLPKTGGSGITSNYFNAAYTSGEFVVGIVGNNTAGVTYYAFSNSGYKDLINKITTLVPSSATDVSAALANSIVDPLQYITSVRWFPSVEIPNTTYTTSMTIGGYPVTLNPGGRMLDASDVIAYYCTVDIPTRSDIRSYMKLAPFRELSLVFQPFGVIPLDSTKLYNSTSVLIEWIIDYTTGSAVLNVYRGAQSYANREGLIYSTSTDYGVDIPISTLKMDWKAGLAISAMQWLGQKSGWSSGPTGEQVLDGMIANGTVTQADLDAAGINVDTTVKPKSMYDTVMDFSAAALGQLSTTGAVGSFLGYMYNKPRIEAWFNYQVEYDDDRFGRPLYQTVLMSNLSGFTICQSPTISFSLKHPLEMEQIAVLQMLSSGIYLE